MRCLERTSLRCAIALLAFALAVPMMYASELGNGDTAPPDVFMNVGGTLLNSINGAIVAPTFTTNYTEWVYSDPNNAFCVGCLDFVYQFTNNGPGVNERFTSYSFEGFRVDAGYESGSGTNLPVTVDRSTNGAVVGFNYTGADNLLAGQTTALLVIETDATNYTDGYVTAQDGTAGYADGFAPAAAVPEPASLALLGSGVLLAGRVVKKRFL